ncbi:hypothetical protein AJ79_09413 [Helicocarpus griseus UAMH5409]|uniref:Helicase ATP-binding domain-containing protein n=1 Tax=Helicocarpus griseus UAMH5409 TaxID=1447875 RepID=A0A2B7WK24_9EURO|nr:hypothetical protein AJ79_09413 [Helicocarpus griseus UAMH5409]
MGKNALTGFEIFAPSDKKRGPLNQKNKGKCAIAKKQPRASAKKWQKKSLTISDLYSSNGIQRAKANVEKPAIPSSSDKNKARALKAIVDNAPVEGRKEAISDRAMIIEASRKFTKVPKWTETVVGGILVCTPASFTIQLQGAAFIRDRERSKVPPFGGFHCDEMRFGKTIQAIASSKPTLSMIEETKGNNVTLIVAPSHLTKHWFEQFAQHCKEEDLGRVMEYHARWRSKTNNDIDHFKDCAVIITTYSEVRMSVPKYEPPAGITQEIDRIKLWMKFFEENCGPLHRMKFRRIILDAVRMLSGQFRWVMSGTPLHNGPHELFAYFDFLRVPMGRDCKQYFLERLQEYGSEDPWVNSVLRTCMLRRGHDETLMGFPILKLPGVEEGDCCVNFCATERWLYRKVIEMFLEEHDSKSIKPKREYQNKFTMLLRLRMFTSHLLIAQKALKDSLTVADMESFRSSVGEDAKPDDVKICGLLQGLVEEHETCAGETMLNIGSVCDCGGAVNQTTTCDGSVESVIAKAQPTASETGDRISMNGSRRKGRKGAGRMAKAAAKSEEESGANWVQKPGKEMPGAKLTAIRSCLKSWLTKPNGTKVVVFTQFLEMVEILFMCDEEGWEHVTHTGKTPIAQRQYDMQSFSDDPSIRILICSLRTGGTGLDLTAANKCILAFFRIFRINQLKDVEFVRIVVRNSIDDRLQAIKDYKTEAIDKAMGSEDDNAPLGWRFEPDDQLDGGDGTTRMTSIDKEVEEISGQYEVANGAELTSDSLVEQDDQRFLATQDGINFTQSAGDAQFEQDFQDFINSGSGHATLGVGRAGSQGASASGFETTSGAGVFEPPKAYEDAKLPETTQDVSGNTEIYGADQATGPADPDIPIGLEDAEITAGEAGCVEDPKE